MHLIGILLGPVSLYAIYSSAHGSGCLEKRDFFPVALRWQAEPWCPSSQRRVCFLFCPLPTSVKSNQQQRSAWLPQSKLQAHSLYSWTRENVFSPVTMASKFSLRPPVLIVQRDLFFLTSPFNNGERSCLVREKIKSGLNKHVMLDWWGYAPSCAVFCNPEWKQLLASTQRKQWATETHENDLVSAFPWILTLL